MSDEHTERWERKKEHRKIRLKEMETEEPIRNIEDNNIIKKEMMKKYSPFLRDADEKLTDKLVTDFILELDDYYCDQYDENTILYVWDAGIWHNGVAEGVITHRLSQIFNNEDSHTKHQLAKIVTFIKGKAMDKELNPAPHNLISFKNGLLNIDTKELGEHDKQYFIVNQIPHNYDVNAECPRWLDWINDTLKEEDIDFFQEWCGYLMYPTITEAAFFVGTGEGQNGKTIAFDILMELVGEKNNTTISLPALSYDGFSRAELYHKLANISDDLGNTVIKNAGELKKASSGSSLNAAKKHGHPFDFKPYAKIMYACNEPPEIRDQSDAIRLRIQPVEFPHQFVKQPTGTQKQARDRDELMEELREELPGIINWAIKGLRRFKKNNSTFTRTQSKDELWLFYLRKSKPVISFFKECITITDNQQDRITPNALYINFCDWLDVNKLKLRISKNKMMKDLREEEDIRPARKREDNQESFYYGVLCDCAPFSSSITGNNINNDIQARENDSRAQSHTLDVYDEDSDEPQYRSPF